MASGRLRPLAEVIARLGAISGQVYHMVEMSRQNAVRGLGTADRLLLANITPEMQQVAVDRRPLSITALSALGSSIPPASEFELSPYGCVEIVLG